MAAPTASGPPAGDGAGGDGVGVIRSGDWAGWDGVADYRAERLSEILVERLVWGRQPGTGPEGWRELAGPGFIWFRFWLRQHEQVVEKYFDGQGRPLGMRADVCAPLQATPEGWWAQDLLLDLWVSPAGRVTVRNEAAFDLAVAAGVIAAAEGAYAEAQLRRLTAATAKGRFPPPLVRGWKVDIKRIKEELSP